MAIRRPLVLNDQNDISELPSGDSVEGALNPSGADLESTLDAHLANTQWKEVHRDTNLSALISSTQVEIQSSTGLNVILTSAATGTAGIMTGALFDKLNGIEAGATADQTGGEIKSLYEAEADTNAFTDAEKSKLASLEGSKYLGTYANLTALQTAHASPAVGSYAHVDAGIGTDVEVYVWDNDDSAYVLMGSGGSETGASIKIKYEGEPDTNAYTDAAKAKVDFITVTGAVNLDTISSNASTAFGWGDHAAAGYLTNYTVTQADVTAHQAALTITESQISDLQAYLTSVSWAQVTGKPAQVSAAEITAGTETAIRTYSPADVVSLIDTHAPISGSGPTIKDSQLVVSSRTTTDPPVGPSNGETYIIPASATGAWLGETNNVARWNGTSWDIETPLSGWIAFVGDENDFVAYGTPTPNIWQDFRPGEVPLESIIIAASDETTALTTGTGKITFRMPYAFTLTGVRASVTTAPVGSALTVDINEGGVSILSTLLTIDDGEKTSTTAAVPAVISDTALADDAEITVDIDGVGSGTAGAGLKIALIGRKA